LTVFNPNFYRVFDSLEGAVKLPVIHKMELQSNFPSQFITNNPEAYRNNEIDSQNVNTADSYIDISIESENL
jgi:hypothetical protein